MKHSAATLYQKEGTKKVLASLISILVGLLVGGIAVILVGCFNEKISLSGAWDGFRIIFAGIFSTGRNAAGELTWGFNAVNTGDMLFRATPLIMTGLSVAVAFKTGLFNIGAPGQYLMGTAATLIACLATYALRNVRWKGLAIPASFPPVIANALIVGAFEITVFFSDSAPTATMAVFNAVAVGVGEIISCCVLGVALVKLIESNESLNKIFAEQ